MKNLPNHIAFICDGNRRLAKRLMKNPGKRHELGIKKVYDIVNWCHELGIKYVTLYALSIQNFGRPKREFNYLMKLFEREFLALSKPTHDIHKYKARVKAIGRINLLPKNVRQAIKKAEKATEKYNKFFLNIAIAYGGQEELTDVCKKIVKQIGKGTIKVKNINKKLIKDNLYSDFSYPDIVIRTGSQKRLSNFLMWQASYSELFFIDTFWPEFEKQEFLKIIEEYKMRRRSFGK